MISFRTTAIAATLGLSMFGLSAPADAAEIEIHMLNKGSDGQLMVFEPAAVKIAPGDTVKFVATDKGHDAISIPDLSPEGFAGINGKISQDVTVTFDKPGAYAFKCAPHFGMGMVGLIVVGDQPANLQAIKDAKLPKKARDRMNEDIAKLGL
jgi:pseudoazurin